MPPDTGATDVGHFEPAWYGWQEGFSGLAGPNSHIFWANRVSELWSIQDMHSEQVEQVGNYAI